MAHSVVDLKLERESDIPVGTQLAWKLRGAIAAGALRGGDRLPPVRELASAAGVNVNTVRAVYARLAAQGVIVSEQGRGTFVTGAGSGSRPDLGELVERAAGDARRHGIDPRELAAVLYARFEEPPRAAAPAAEDVAARRAVRAEIEALEHELADLEPLSGQSAGEGGKPVRGARLVSTEELESTRDLLAARVTEIRRARRQGRSMPAARPKAQPVSVWPELLPLAPA
jgi:DNA-binding transcriptional regulator YhcF (GntR family)